MAKKGIGVGPSEKERFRAERTRAGRLRMVAERGWREIGMEKASHERNAETAATSAAAEAAIQTRAGAARVPSLHGMLGSLFSHSQYLSLIRAVPVRSTHWFTRPPEAHERTTR